jgi:hypothetical protein
MPRLLAVLIGLSALSGCLDRSPRPEPPPRRLPDRDTVAKLLPPDVRLDTVADADGARNVMVEEELVRVGARVGEDGRLQDARGRPIKFFRLTGCWGNPPGNYQQIIDEQNRALAELRKTHRVITLTCNPSGMPVP